MRTPGHDDELAVIPRDICDPVGGVPDFDADVRLGADPVSRVARKLLDAAVQLLLAACYLWTALWVLLLMTASTGACDGPRPNQISDALPPALCVAFVAGGVAGSWGCFRWLKCIRHPSHGPTGFDVLPPR